MAATTKTIRLVIAEKTPLMQSSLTKLFGDDTGFELLTVTTDGEAFLQAVDKMEFDVGVTGWELPPLGARGVLQALRGRPQAPRIVVYTGSSDPDVPRQAMALGAAGFCSKNDPPQFLLDTVRSVAAGKMVFPFIDVARLASDPLAGLTPRERELLSALAGGFTNQQMAQQLDISLNTVKFHLKNLYDKLGVSNRAQAVAFYLKGREGR